MSARPAKVEAMIAAVLSAKGDTDPALRRAVAVASGGKALARDPAPPIPETLAPLLHQIAHRAYQITDEDVAAVLAAGFSEDAVFELTIAAALGAGLARLDVGLALLDAKPEGGTPEVGTPAEGA